MAKADIPKIIHVIWVGGAMKPVQKEYLRKWKRSNPDYQIWLWYDSKHMIANDLRVAISQNFSGAEKERVQVQASWASSDRRLHMLQTILAVDCRKRASKNHRTLVKYTTSQKLGSLAELKDVRDLIPDMQNSFYYEMEMVNRGGNFGAASDLLRIEILYHYGGIYSDIDLGSLKGFGGLTCDTDLALIGRYNTLLSNALLASHPRSRFMAMCRDRMGTNYKQLRSNDCDMEQYYRDMRKATIQLTGPSCVKMVAQHFGVVALEKRKSEWVSNRYFWQSKTYHDRAYHDARDWYEKELGFPEGFVTFDTEEQKSHDWLEAKSKPAKASTSTVVGSGKDPVSPL